MQLIKDLVVSVAVWRFGGIAVDLDYLDLCHCSRVTLPIVGTEPVKTLPPQRLRRSRITVARMQVGLNYGLLGTAKSSAWLLEMIRNQVSRWHGFATRTLRCKHDGEPKSSVFMKNQIELQEVVCKRGLKAAALPALHCSPLPVSLPFLYLYF